MSTASLLAEMRKSSKILELLHQQRPNYHPALGLINVLDQLEAEQADYKLQADIHKTLLSYVAPQLKSVEVVGEVNHNHGLLRVQLDVPKDIPLTYNAPDALPAEFSKVVDNEILSQEVV
jgi:hypothetical protein